MEEEKGPKDEEMGPEWWGADEGAVLDGGDGGGEDCA